MQEKKELNQLMVSSLDDALRDLWRLYLVMDVEELSDPDTMGRFASIAATMILARQQFDVEHKSSTVNMFNN